MTAALGLAEFATDLRAEDVPADVLEAAKLHLLDTLGCGLAAHALGEGAQGRAAMAELGGEPQATVIGLPARLPAPAAPLANPMICHGGAFDHTHPGSKTPDTTGICPPALGVAEARGASGRDALVAIVAGNEVMARLGMAGASRFHARGFHPTSICGIFGATAAAARLGGLDASTTASALGLAGSMASGIFAFLADGTATKPLHPAWAAHGGVLAARLGALGLEGPPSVVEGKFGLYHAFLAAGPGEIDAGALLDGLGSTWETPRIAFKAYPACHFMHGALGAIRQVGSGVDPAEIEEVVVVVPPEGVSLVLEPAATKVAPRTEYEGKFSLQYSAAALLVRGRLGVSDYTDEAIRDPEVLELARRVTYETREYPTYPQAFPGGARIRLREGRVLAAELPHQQGSPENPLTAAKVREKYRENAALALGEGAVLELEEAVLELEERADLGAALAPLARAGVSR